VNDISLIYYTAKKIDERFAEAVRDQLWLSVRKAFSPLPCRGGQHVPILRPMDVPPVVCVIQAERTEPMKYFPVELDTIYTGAQPASIWQVYQNILAAARATATPFVACCEDDTVYAPEHFTYRPPLDTFAYDRNRWVITKRLHPQTGQRETIFYWRERHQMAMCIAPRELLIETLEEKFAKYPVPPVSTDVAKKAGWGEPGRYEKNLGLTRRNIEYFDAPSPSVTFNHDKSLMGRRQWKETDRIVTDLPPWGNAEDLWSRIHG